MSAIPHVHEGIIVERIPRIERDAFPNRPIRVRVRSRGVTWADVARYGFSVFVASVVIHFVGGFSVQLATEEARRAAILAGARAQTAEVEAAVLRRQIERLQSSERVDSWAALNGFVSSYFVSNDQAAR